MTIASAEGSERILIHAPFGKDGAHLGKVLGSAGYSCVKCDSLDAVVRELGVNAGVILTTEEALLSHSSRILSEALNDQPPWSAIPVLVFYSPRSEDDFFKPRIADPLHGSAEINFLQRPVTTRALLSAIEGAIRDRRRQYKTKLHLELLEADIRQREHYERELRKAHRASEEAKIQAEQANRSKSQFLANMSHEIRTPLGAIMGFTDLIAHPETTKQDTIEYISVVQRNSSQLLRIIDDILDLAKVEAGKIDFENIEVSLPELLSDFSVLLGLRARENGIHFEMTCLENLPGKIISDPVRIRQILMNIVGNAIKFTTKGRVDFQISYSDGFLIFEVKDTGRGISEEQRTVLFQAFTQADSSTTRKYGGTGLGLVLTRRLCEAMGGSFILKESELGRGSTFVAKIKVLAIDSENLPTKPEQVGILQTEDMSGFLKGVRILLVEDSPDNQALINILLTRAGAEVDIAADGKAGVELALANSYSVILMDVQMPVMDGLQAVRIIRQHDVNIPVIAFTAHAMKEEHDRCLKAGFSDFLSKPIQKEALMESLHRMLNTSLVRIL